MRVYEIARIAGVQSADVRNYLSMLGQPVKSASSLVKGDAFVATLISRLQATKDDFARVYVEPPF